MPPIVMSSNKNYAAICGAALCIFSADENLARFSSAILVYGDYDFCPYVLLSKKSSFTHYELSHSDLRVKGETRIWIILFCL